MNDFNASVFVKTSGRLPLVTSQGRAFLGLQHSRSPELAGRMESFFEYLNGVLGFADTVEGQRSQACFNTILRAAYPEVMLDLADLIFVQHERPAVFLNFDHININLRRDRAANYGPLDRLNQNMGILFQQLARRLREDPAFFNDPEIVRLLSESYSYYLYQTKNFPWDDPFPDLPPGLDRPVMDIATGLAGFSRIHQWPEPHPKLILTDHMPFIVQGLNHYKNLVGKTNVDILPVDFGGNEPDSPGLGCILATKFLHHLQRPQRRRFLQWARDNLAPGGVLRILDTDLENRILQRTSDPEFRKRLNPGYLETLVDIERNFCETLVGDTRQTGFRVTHFDFNEYEDETDAYSLYPGDNLLIRFLGFEISAEKTGGAG
ncbi:MAG: hypothetical protein ACE5E9_11985 [Nitrospinaceae bacterium]